MDSWASYLMLISLLFTTIFRIIETNIQMSMVAEELEENATLLCGCKFDSESTFSVQWYKSINVDRFVEDGKALASWNLGDIESLPGFGIGDNVSLILYNVDLGDKGLFRCIVTLNDGLNSCKHDVILNIYANPDNPPMISYKRHPTGLNVTCSVDSVFPMNYPNFIMNKTGKSERHYNENADGTFDTAVTNTFPLNYTTIQCAYSTLKVNSISSLQIEHDINKHDQKPGDGIMNQTDMTNTSSGDPLIYLTIVLEIMQFCAILSIILLVYKCPPVHTLYYGHRESSEKKDKSKRSRAVKLCCLLIIPLIPILVICILIAYLIIN